MAAAGVTFFLHVVHIAVGCELAIAADDAAAGKRGEPEESNKTAHDDPLCGGVEQFLCPCQCLHSAKRSPGANRTDSVFSSNFCMLPRTRRFGTSRPARVPEATIINFLRRLTN